MDEPPADKRHAPQLLGVYISAPITLTLASVFMRPPPGGRVGGQAGIIDTQFLCQIIMPLETRAKFTEIAEN
jgi:hypothetical protein